MKNYWPAMLLCLFLVCMQNAAAEQVTDLYPFNNAADSQRFSTLTNNIRCVVCQSQSIADSEAPLAKDLRQKVFLFIEAHKSDTEIEAYLQRRYGDYILFKPSLGLRTSLLWLFPFLGLLAVVLLLLPMIRFKRTRE